MLKNLIKEFSNFFNWVADIIIADEYLEKREEEWKDVDYTKFNLN